MSSYDISSDVAGVVTGSDWVRGSIWYGLNQAWSVKKALADSDNRLQFRVNLAYNQAALLGKVAKKDYEEYLIAVTDGNAAARSVLVGKLLEISHPDDTNGPNAVYNYYNALNEDNKALYLSQIKGAAETILRPYIDDPDNNKINDFFYKDGKVDNKLAAFIDGLLVNDSEVAQAALDEFNADIEGRLAKNQIYQLSNLNDATDREKLKHHYGYDAATNFKYIWREGLITGPEGITNLSNNFTIIGDGRKSIHTDRFGNGGVLNNEGTIAQVGDASVYFNSLRSSLQNGHGYLSGHSMINNNGMYELQGDGDLLSGEEYYYPYNNISTYRSNADRGIGVFNNTGTFKKSSGTGVSSVSAYINFNNTGLVDVNSGTLSIGTLTSSIDNSARYVVGAGSTLRVNRASGSGSRFEVGADALLAIRYGHMTDPSIDIAADGVAQVGSTINGSLLLSGLGTFEARGVYGSGEINGRVGDFLIKGGLSADTGKTLTLAFDSNMIAKLSGGSVGGNGSTINKGGFEWLSGKVTGSGGLLNISDNFKITGDGRKSISALSWLGLGNLINEGTVTHIGDSNVYFDSFISSNRVLDIPVLNNKGTYILEGDGDFKKGTGTYASEWIYGTKYAVREDHGRGVINNSGTFVKTAGTGVSEIGDEISFNNAGKVNVESGTLSIGTLTSSIDNSARYVVGAGSTLRINRASGSGSRFEVGADALLAIRYGHMTDPSIDIAADGVAQVGSTINGSLLLSGLGTFEARGVYGSGEINGRVGDFLIKGGLSADTGKTLTLAFDSNMIAKLSGGSVGGNGSTINKGGFEWLSGKVTGSGGLLNISDNFKITGDGRKSISALSWLGLGNLINEGTVTHIGDSNVYFDSFISSNRVLDIPVLNNKGTYILEGDGDFKKGTGTYASEWIYGTKYAVREDHGRGVINNSGTFVKTAGTGVSEIGDEISFNNAGKVNVESGTLSIGSLITTGTVDIKEEGTLSKKGNYTQSTGETKVNGILNANNVIIEDGSLSGNGVINANVSVNGILSPGNSPGILDIFGDLTLLSGGELFVEIAGNDGNLFDQVFVHGDAIFENASIITFDFTKDFAPMELDYFDFFLADSVNANFDLITFNILGLQNGFLFDTEFIDGAIRLTALNNGVSSVPIPSALQLFISGFIMLSFIRRRFRPIP